VPRSRRREPRQPSPKATDRLRDSLRIELGELSIRFEEAHLRSEALHRLGRDAAAMDALDESRGLLRTYQARIEQSLAAAAVEREAEWIMDAAGEQVHLIDLTDVLNDPAALRAGGVDDHGQAAVFELDHVRRSRARAGRIPATLSAAAASVLVLGLGLATLRAPGRAPTPTMTTQGDLVAQGSPVTPAAGSTAPRATATALPWGYSSEAEVLAEIDADDPVVGALLTRRRALLDQLVRSSQPGEALLSELEAITDLLAGVGVSQDLLLWLDDFEAAQVPGDGAEHVAPSGDREPAPADQTGDEPVPADAPADAPADDPASEEPADGDGDGDGVFDGFGDDDDSTSDEDTDAEPQDQQRPDDDSAKAPDDEGPGLPV